MNQLSDETRALLDKRALAIYADILYDLAAAASAIEATYGGGAWDARRVIAELPDFQRGLRALCAGLDMPLRAQG
jgi:hypothetical protein